MAEGDQKTSEDLALVLNELGNRMERLKQLYEQYFMGIERIEPLVARKEVTRSMMALQQQYIRNTGLRFKFNTMLQRWSIYLTYWNRTLREIENGTYVRHIQKAQRKAEKEGRSLPNEMRRRSITGPLPEVPTAAPAAVAQGAAAPPPITPAFGVRTQTPATGSVRILTPPHGAPMTPPSGAARATPLGVPGMSETELRALHKKYVDARSASGENAAVRYETLVASLAKQVPKVLQQPGVRGVKFDVAIVDGKAILKATPTR